jgi:hypothetical protein
MKLFVYLLSVVVIIALAGLFVIKQPNGQPWLSANEFKPNTQAITEKINTITSKLKKVFESDIAKKDGAVKVYRWKDSKGNWNYSDTDNATNSEEVLYDPKDIIVLPALKPPSPDLTNLTDSTTHKKNTNADPAPETLIPSPNKVLELYKDAKNVQSLIDSRQDKLSQAIKDSSG